MRGLLPWMPEAAPLRLFGEDLDNLMIRLFGNPEARVMKPIEEKWAPCVDFEETEKEVFVKADLPGVDPKEVVIEVIDGMLILRGTRKVEREEKEVNFFRTERFVGEFYRALPLPGGIDVEKITARSHHGVITVVIPKKPEVLPRKIAVEPEVHD
jgi:HSP20 family protein